VLFAELRLNFNNMFAGMFAGLHLLSDLCLVQTPLLIVLFVGLLRAANHSTRSPRVSALTLLAVVLMLVQSLILVFWTASLAHPDPHRLRNNLVILEAVRALASAGTWALLLWALFGSRGQVAPRESVHFFRSGKEKNRHQFPQCSRPSAPLEAHIA
jgi:hypothetical protein